MTPQALFDARDAATYLGVSRSFFLEHIRKHLNQVDMRAPGADKPMPRWERVELDRYIAKRKRGVAAA